MHVNLYLSQNKCLQVVRFFKKDKDRIKGNILDGGHGQRGNDPKVNEESQRFSRRRAIYFSIYFILKNLNLINFLSISTFFYSHSENYFALTHFDNSQPRISYQIFLTTDINCDKISFCIMFITKASLLYL